MLLEDANGSELELNIIGYEFPDAVPKPGEMDYDANWLFIAIKVKSPQGSWEDRDPCLLTWEADQLAKWLEGMSKDLPFVSYQTFMEPNLDFRIVEHTDDRFVVRVGFGLEFRPPWNDTYRGEVEVDLHVSREDVRRAAHDLLIQLHRFPPRKARKT